MALTVLLVVPFQYGILHIGCSADQLCPTRGDLMDYSPTASSFHGFYQQEYWSGLPFPLLGDCPNTGIKLVSPASLALASGFFITEPPGILATL